MYACNLWVNQHHLTPLTTSTWKEESVDKGGIWPVYYYSWLSMFCAWPTCTSRLYVTVSDLVYIHVAWCILQWDLDHIYHFSFAINMESDHHFDAPIQSWRLTPEELMKISSIVQWKLRYGQQGYKTYIERGEKPPRTTEYRRRLAAGLVSRRRKYKIVTEQKDESDELLYRNSRITRKESLLLLLTVSQHHPTFNQEIMKDVLWAVTCHLPKDVHVRHLESMYKFCKVKEVGLSYFTYISPSNKHLVFLFFFKFYLFSYFFFLQNLVWEALSFHRPSDQFRTEFHLLGLLPSFL